jgi:hypothetical protein
MFDSIRALDPEVLSRRLLAYRSNERKALVEFLIHLAEFDRRELHLQQGYPSLFSYLTGELGYSKASAYRRSTAARLLLRFPAAADSLREGGLGLTTLSMLKGILTEENHHTVLEQAAGRTEEEVERLVVSYQPKVIPPNRVQRFPAPKPEAPSITLSSGPEPTRTAPQERPTQAEVHPLTTEMHLLRLVVPEPFMRELAEVKALLGHKVPSGDLVAVLRECIQTTLKVRAQRKRGGERPRASKPAKPTGRYISAEVRREVARRDGHRCTYTAPSGKRCDCRRQLEYEHVIPYAQGGTNTVDNLVLLCSSHNRLRAQQVFGREFMLRFRKSGP